MYESSFLQEQYIIFCYDFIVGRHTKIFKIFDMTDHALSHTYWKRIERNLKGSSAPVSVKDYKKSSERSTVPRHCLRLLDTMKHLFSF